MTKRKNLESLIKIMFYIFLELVLFYGLAMNKLGEYVHPRYNIGVGISICIIFLFLLIEIPLVMKARHNENLAGYFVYFIPLFLVFLFPAGIWSKGNVQVSEIAATGATDEPTTNWHLISQEEGRESAATGDAEDSEIEEATEFTEIEIQGHGVEECRKRLAEDGTMEISDDIFADWYEDIYANPDLYIGKRVTYVSQVFFMDELEENQFIAGRYFMICCIADLTGCGIISESEEINNFQNEAWVKVTGTIGTCDYNGGTVPKLIDVVVEETTAPNEEYIYYNYY